MRILLSMLHAYGMVPGPDHEDGSVPELMNEIEAPKQRARRSISPYDEPHHHDGDYEE